MIAYAPAAPDRLGRFSSAVAAAIDGMALRTARAVIDRTLMPPPEAADELRLQARFYQSPELVAEPRRFFPFADEPEPVPVVTERVIRSFMRDAVRSHVAFRSPYRPLNPAFAAEHATHAENHWVHAELWRHRATAPRGSAILLHGFGMGRPAFDALVLMAPALYASGLDVALVTLPFHGKRKPKASRFSGQLFASASVVRLNEAMGQAAHDVIAFVAWLRHTSAAPVGVLGLSLGGYVAALLAALIPDLAFVVPVVAPVCFGDLGHRFMASSIRYRAKPGMALDRDEFRAAYRVHSPLAHPPRVPRERLMIVAGRGDRVVPPEHTEWLAAHWDRPRTTWFSGSHIAPFGRAGMTIEIRRFLLGLL
jgi:pimeloyl-ACP methyl ester carboxylesterase